MAARVVLVDPAGRVLLFRGFDPARPGATWWFTVGGGVEPGEDLRAAALREAREETGLDLAELRGPVWRRLANFSFDGRRYEAEEWFFTATATGPVDTSGFTELEARTVVEHRWWSAAELRATSEVFYPARLPELLDGLPDHPDGPPLLLDDREPAP
ncbi:NUDIX hydrolase [Pseudonocardia sp. CA-107938]|uniref:NUDIX hydrolase n=1 Tax=Pseudonocardia sp. CA-107938 TaxID=3240021 RepID=UPI003D93DA83